MKLSIRSGEAAGRSIEIGTAPFVIGRDASCDLALDDDDKVSRRHASIEVADDGAVTLRDLESTNGVFVGGDRITGSATLTPGQAFRVGDTVLAVEADAPARAAAPPTAAVPPLPGTRAAARPQPPTQSPAAPPPGAPGRATPPPGVGTSTIRRRKLEKSVRRTSLIAGGLAVIVIVLVVLLVTGVLPPDSGDSNGSVAETVKKVTPSTVLVITTDGTDPVGTGTGWVFNADKGLIVTNNHVVNGGTAWHVVPAGDEKSKPREARLVATAPCDDLALLKVADTKDLKSLPLGSQDDIEQGQTVVALGFPRNASAQKDLTTTDGIVSVTKTRTKDDSEDLPNVLRTTAAINPGNSGGPLVTLDGKLVGINTLAAPRENEAYSIGVDRVKEFLPRLEAGHSPYWTGLNTLDPAEFGDAPALLERLDFPVNGLIVTGSVPGTPGARSAIGKQLALIYSIDGRRQDGLTSTYCKAVRGQSRATFNYVTPGSRTLRSVEIPFAR